jgi:hypothetical protein
MLLVYVFYCIISFIISLECMPSTSAFLEQVSFETGTVLHVLPCPWYTALQEYELSIYFHSLFYKVLRLQEIIQSTWRNSI